MVQKKIKEIIWSDQAKDHFYEILKHLENEAPHVIEIVGNAILDTIEEAAINYNIYPLDRFKKKNDGTYRAVLIYSYRISYQVGIDHINILRIRHTSRAPLKH